MRVAVTGAGGFIGRHVVTALVERGHDVLALVHRTPSVSGVESCTFDLSSPADIASKMKGVDACVHAAAYVPSSYSDPDEARACLEINALGTLAILRACVHKVAKVVLLSAGNIYRLGNTPAREEDPIDPSARAPYYLASKACADFYAEHFDREKDLPVAILRPSAVYGPGLARGMIPTFAASLSAGKQLMIHDGGVYRADLVYVVDVATAVAEAVVRPARGPFNLGTGSTSSALEIAQTLIRILKAPTELLGPVEPIGQPSIGFPPLDITRARRELGFSPRNIEAGLSSYLASHQVAV